MSSTSSKLPAQSRHDWRTTSIFLGTAAGFACVTLLVQWLTQPAAIEEYGKVGQVFYSDFVDPTIATELEVNAFDKENVRPLSFRVKQLANGRWVIPSHHDYPADAEEQLAKTASSIVGIKRGAMVTRWPADHARYGVVDPKQDSLAVKDVEGVGQRLTLRKGDEQILADFIIGKPVDESTDEYYVRHPSEDEVYITSLDIDLSTRFADWVNTDLLEEINSSDITRLTLNDYSFDEVSGSLTTSEISKLSRAEEPGSDWILEGLNTETEQVKASAISETINAAANLKIVGVRPKQKGLTADLKLDRENLSSQRDVDRLQSDLLSRGFLLQPGQQTDVLKLLAKEGEMYVGTNDGILFSLYFGRVFTGSQEELEVGFANGSSADENSPADKAEESKPQDTESKGDDTKSTENSEQEDAGSEKETKSNEKPGRYVFVRAEFDRSLLGPEPQEPTEPQKSAELIEAEKQAEAEKANEQEGAAAEPTEEPTDPCGQEPQEGPTPEQPQTPEKPQSGDSQQPTQPENAATSPPKQPAADTPQSQDPAAQDPAAPQKKTLEELQREFMTAQAQYSRDLSEYNAYQEKVKAAEEKAEKLNRRFAQWYYVISGESYDQLSLSRADLIEPKQDETQVDPNAAPGQPSGLQGLLNGGGLPNFPATPPVDPSAAQQPPVRSEGAGADQGNPPKSNDDAPAAAGPAPKSDSSTPKVDEPAGAQPAEKADSEATGKKDAAQQEPAKQKAEGGGSGDAKTDKPPTGNGDDNQSS